LTQGGLVVLQKFHGASTRLTEILTVWDSKKKGTLQAKIDEKLLLTAARIMELSGSKGASQDISVDADNLVRHHEPNKQPCGSPPPLPLQVARQEGSAPTLPSALLSPPAGPTAHQRPHESHTPPPLRDYTR